MSKRSVESFGPPPLPRPPKDHFWKIEQSSPSGAPTLWLKLKKKSLVLPDGEHVQSRLVESRRGNIEKQVVKAAKELLEWYAGPPRNADWEHLEGEYE